MLGFKKANVCVEGANWRRLPSLPRIQIGGIPTSSPRPQDYHLGIFILLGTRDGSNGRSRHGLSLIACRLRRPSLASKHGNRRCLQVGWSWVMTMTDSGCRVFPGLWMSLVRCGPWKLGNLDTVFGAFQTETAAQKSRTLNRSGISLLDLNVFLLTQTRLILDDDDVDY